MVSSAWDEGPGAGEWTGRMMGGRRGFFFCLGSRGDLVFVRSECSLAMRTSTVSLTGSSYILDCLSNIFCRVVYD